MASKVTSQEQNLTDRTEVTSELLELCCAGDKTSQRALYERCGHQVYGLMIRIAGIRHAEDLTQQVFLQVFRKLNQFEGSSRFETWLYRLATNEALQFLRKERRWKFQQLDFDLASRKVEHTEDQKDVLETALQKLDPELRTVFVLKEVESLSYREIANVMDIPEGTVGSRLNKARNDLQKYLVELGWEV